MERLNHRGSIVVNTTVVHHRGMSRQDPQFKLRMTEELRDQIAEAAKASNRSMNAEIIARLEQSFAIADSPEKEFHLSRAQLDELVQSVTNQVAEHLASAPESLGRTSKKAK